MNEKVREEPGQMSWMSLGLQDLRHLNLDQVYEPPPEVAAGSTHESALAILEHHFGVNESFPDRCFVTPVVMVTLCHKHLSHIVEKRQDARERYVLYAIRTIEDPFEVWLVKYTNNSMRYAFIGAYASAKQMYVVVDIQSENVLWNFMQCDAKKLNKHRQGQILYQRGVVRNPDDGGVAGVLGTGT